MRNPFLRQTETAAPSLRDRAADLSGRLASATRKPETAFTAPAEDTFTPAPTGLAAACLWAARRRAWIDNALKVSEWSDEEFDAESGKTNAVFTRAINEPSASLREITAKAALALEDFERFSAHPGLKLDDGGRLVHTVLREVAAFQVEAASPLERDLSRDAFYYAWELDLSPVPLENLICLSEASHRAAEALSEIAQEDGFWTQPNRWFLTVCGEVIDAEQNRLG
ncbi:hypothetical protein [Methylobacterium sp. J-076]|uniref:hypothetical protein n=1 Tax=Methylobacterium sp. J-076 TaxID=2836655 RepID=UPI001FBC03A2|nr:hypothetical protein [Methylobacterium sp. J-076]MCJ2012316.1 hypothetical protein [Methylobacterium sp. J-076]